MRLCYGVDDPVFHPRRRQGGAWLPIFEFYCSDCRGKFEVLTSYENSQGQMVCATCHGTNVRKLLSVFARPSRGGSDDFGDGGEYDGGDDDDYGGSGGCSCGGACSCNN
jgi:putative FmdB family regulatory protein